MPLSTKYMQENELTLTRLLMSQTACKLMIGNC